MKILMIIATGAIITFPMDKSVEADCFEQGHSILKNISTYHDTGNRDQGWYLKGKPIQVAGWYCKY
jgi:hypothetical protein